MYLKIYHQAAPYQKDDTPLGRELSQNKNHFPNRTLNQRQRKEFIHRRTICHVIGLNEEDAQRKAVLSFLC